MVALGSKSGIAASVWMAGGFLLLAVLAFVSLQNQLQASEQLKVRLSEAHDELAAAGRPVKDDFPVLGTAAVEKNQTKEYKATFLKQNYNFSYPTQWQIKENKAGDSVNSVRIYSNEKLADATTAPTGQGIVEVTPLQLSYIQSADDFKKLAPGKVIQQRQYTTPKNKRVVELVVDATDGQRKIAYIYADDKAKTYYQISEPSLTQQADDAGQIIIDSFEVK